MSSFPAPSTLNVVSGTLGALAAASPGTIFPGGFSIYIGGTFSATVLLERSPDGGTTYYPCSLDPSGTISQWTTSCSVDAESLNIATLYRLRVTSYASGTINYVLQQASPPG